MKISTLGFSLTLLASSAFADIREDVRFCFDRFSNDTRRAAECASSELARAVKNLQDFGGGGERTDTLTIEYQCGRDGARDTYTIIASGKESAEIRERARLGCKWDQFAAVKQWLEVRGSKSLSCQCGVDNASDTFTVIGFGQTYGEAYDDAKAGCKWSPILRNCSSRVATAETSVKNAPKAQK
jgi:hypothetical protein